MITDYPTLSVGQKSGAHSTIHCKRDCCPQEGVTWTSQVNTGDRKVAQVRIIPKFSARVSDVGSVLVLVVGNYGTVVSWRALPYGYQPSECGALSEESPWGPDPWGGSSEARHNGRLEKTKT